MPPMVQWPGHPITTSPTPLCPARHWTVAWSRGAWASLLLDILFLGNCRGELDEWQGDPWGRRAGEVKIPRKGQFDPFLPSDLCMMDLTAAVPRLLSCLRKKLLFQSRSCCSELKEFTCSSTVWFGGALVSQAVCDAAALGSQTPSLVRLLFVCLWGLCLFFSNSAQTQLHCSVTQRKGCSLLPSHYRRCLWYLLS